MPPARPKARALKAAEAEQIAARLKAAIDCSPILRAFGVQVRSLRGRFYLEWRWDPVDRPEEALSYGRITPLKQPPGELLLEVLQPKPGEFAYAETGKPCSVQETLYHFFGLPIHVIAQPSGWYSCHWTPRIVE